MATVIARPHPLRTDCVKAELKPGATLRGTFGDLPECVLSQVDGEVWGRDRWSEALPDDALVTLYSTPEGDIGRAVAMIAVAVVAAYTGGAAAAAMGFAKGTTAFAVASAATSAAVTLAGSLAVNALIPPKMPDAGGAGQSPNVRQSITGTRNQMDPYGVVPRVYGNPRWYPKLAARPVTEVAGNDQYLRMLLCLGYGPLEVAGTRVGAGYPRMSTQAVGDAIRIGETPIDQYDDVELEIGTPAQLSLDYPDIHEESVGAVLNPTGDIREGEWVPDTNPPVTRTTAPNTREISLDLTFPLGVYTINRKGDMRSSGARFRIEYRQAGSHQWAIRNSRYEVRDSNKNTQRKNVRWEVPVGQYEVRITRLSTLHYGNKGTYADCTWGVLRSIQQGPAYTGDHVVMALRIRATDQLNGVIDQLNVKTQAVLRTYNGTSFVDQATSNPAWAYLDAMAGAQVGRPVPDQQIDWEALQDWAAFCYSQGLGYSFVHDASETVLERARAIASTGQASFALQDGKFSVVRDDPTAPVVQAITPRNATGFSSSRQFKDLPHALRVKYIDPDTWSDAERIVYREGYDASNATRFEDFETQGVASSGEAYHHGMYHMRQAILRPETHRVSMDWENLVCMRGNRVRLAYDAIKVGLSWGRVKEVVGADLVLDQEVVYETSRAYGIRVRGADGPQSTTSVYSGTFGRTNRITMSTPVDVQVGDLVLYGVLDQESVDCKVSRIEHGSDFTADLTLVPTAADIYNYADAPTWDAGITNPIPLDRIKPPTPVITSARGDESAAHLNHDGSFQTLIRVGYSLSAQGGLPSLEVEARYRAMVDGQPGEWEKAGPFSASGSLTISNVEDGSDYDIQVRAINGAMYSDWSQTVTLTVTGQAVTAPTSVEVRVGTFSSVLIPQGVTATQQWEFYRSQSSLALGDVEAMATRLGVGAVWTDTDLHPNTAYYYYVRGWSPAYTSAWYAVDVTTHNDPTAVMSAISGEIKKGDLWPALEQEIDRIDLIGTEVDGIAVDVSGISDRADAIEGDLAQTQQDLNDEAARLDGRVDGVQSTLTSEASRLDGEITSVSDSLDAARTALEQSDAELSDRLDAADSAIVEEREERETEQGFIVDRLDGLVSNVGDNRASIGRLQRIQQEGDELDAIIYEALNVESASRQASIRTEEQVRIEGGSALAMRSDALEADIGDANARITTVDQARIDGDSALSSQIGELSAKVNALPQFASGFEAGADFGQWSATSGSTLTAEPSDIYAGLQSALLSGTISAAIPTGAADAFGGYEVTIRVAAKQPSSNASTEIAVRYQPNGAWQSFPLSTTWESFDFTYVVPEGQSGDALEIRADAGKAALVGAVSVRRVAGEILEITAAIEQANQARADGDAALTQQLNALTTTVGNNASSIQQEAQTRASETQALTQTTNAIRSDVDDNAAGITTVEQTVADTESALSSRIDGLSARTGQNEASITAEQTARANADDALGVRIDSVEASAGDNAAAIQSEVTARTDADTALGQRIDTVEAAAGDNSAAIQSEITARADETGANAARIGSLSLSRDQQAASIQALQRLRGEDGELEAIQFEALNVESASRRASVRTEEQARIEDGVAFASRMSSIEASVDDVDARVTSEASARADADSSLGQRIDTVQAGLDGVDSAVQSEASARADADSALGQRIDTVVADVADNQAAIQSESTARADEDSALGQRIDTVQTTAGDNSTAIQQEITARTDADSALGSQISTVQSQLGGDIASVQQQAQTSIDAQKDRIDAMWTLRTDVNGLVGGMGLANDGDEVDLAIRSDKFSIAPPGLPENAVVPFIVKGSTTYLKEAMIDQLTFGKLTDAGGTFIVQNGKLKAEYIETNSLIVSSGNVTGLGSLATKSGVNYNELGGTKPPSNADNTGSNTAADTAKVAGETAASIKSKANGGNAAKSRVDGWSYPGTTEIHGAHIRTGTIKADKIQIGGSGGLGSLSGKDSVDYSEVVGTKPPSNADKTSSNTSYDTSRVAGTAASTVRNRANNGNAAKNRVNYWTKPNKTTIDGNKITTGEAYVDTLEIKGQAVTIPMSKQRGSVSVPIGNSSISSSTWKDLVSISTGNIMPGGGSVPVTVLFSWELNYPGTTPSRVQVEVVNSRTGRIYLESYQSNVEDELPLTVRITSMPASGGTIKVRARMYQPYANSGDTGRVLNPSISAIVSKR